MPKPHTLICTLGTSLFGNLRRLAEAQQSDPDREALAKAYSGRDWAEVASHLVKIAPSEQVCGAEINSVEILASDKVERVNLHLLHSDTDDGRAIAGILQSYFKAHGWHNVSCHTLDGLRDDDPNLFRTQGLRNLAKKCGELVRFAGGAEFCAINATGGYKAQIAIAVLIGQALDIPVYYKHEFFRTDAIISFPPMPVALDFSLWERASGMFMALSRANAFEPWQHFEDDWDERFEPLVDRVDVDGAEYLELSPAGQIFHETFLQRFQQFKTERLPPRQPRRTRGTPGWVIMPTGKLASPSRISWEESRGKRLTSFPVEQPTGTPASPPQPCFGCPAMESRVSIPMERGP